MPKFNSLRAVLLQYSACYYVAAVWGNGLIIAIRLISFNGRALNGLSASRFQRFRSCYNYYPSAVPPSTLPSDPTDVCRLGWLACSEFLNSVGCLLTGQVTKCRLPVLQQLTASGLQLGVHQLGGRRRMRIFLCCIQPLCLAIVNLAHCALKICNFFFRNNGYHYKNLSYLLGD
jgi:hypothetical protein